MRQMATLVANRIGRRLGVEVRPMPVPVERVIADRLGVDSVRTVFDVGANEGRTALRYARLFPAATIHSFEPFPEAFGRLRANTAGEPRITPHALALGAAEQHLDLHVNRNSYTNSLLPNSERIGEYAPHGWTDPVGTVSVPVTTLDAFCAANAVASIDLLKIDTQGYEMCVFEGAAKTLTPARVKFVYVELNFVPLYEGQAPYDRVVTFLRERGYRLFNLFDAAVDPASGIKWADALFITA